MDVIQAIVLGIVQGLTEFLPVSSSGHLAITPFLFGWDQQSLDFDIIVHGATLLTIVIFYRKKLFAILTAILSKEPKSRDTNLSLIKNIVLTSLPAVAIGLFAKDIIESNTDNIPVISAALIIIGILLVYLNRLFKNTTKIDNLEGKKALFIGAMQSMALIRGVSRSGITIIGGALSGLNKKDAVDYAFLASIPVIFGSFVLALFDIAETGIQEDLTVLVAGFISAFVSGYLAISFLLRYVKNHDFAIFGYYRIILGIILLAIAL